MYGLMYPDGGEVESWTPDLYVLMDLYKRSNNWAAAGESIFDGATPVVQVGTNPDDLQWETFSDAYVEIPDAWFEWLSQP